MIYHILFYFLILFRSSPAMPGIETPGGVPANKRDVLYDLFVQAGTFQGIFKTFFELCEELNLKPFAEHRNFYPKFKSQLTSWKAASLWSKLDKRYNRKEYKKGKACNNTRVSEKLQSVD